MAFMSPQSKIICYHDELQSALQAALKVADKNLFGLIQFRPIPEDQVVQISALNPTSTFVATVPTEMCDIVDRRDEVFECLLSEASVMAKFPIKTPPGSDGEVAKAGLIIAESWIQITDETGLGIGIRHTRVRRNSEVDLPGSHIRTLETAADTPEDSASVMYPAQLDLAGKVAHIMGQKARLRCIEAPDGVLSRVLLTGTTYGLTLTEGKPQEKDVSDDQPISFADAIGADAEGVVSSSEVLRLVGAKPVGGIS